MMLQEEEVTQQEKDTIVAYLAKALPKKVNVNKGSAQDLQLVLEITPAQAAALIAARPFKAVEDLRKLVDSSKLESEKDRLEF